MWLVNTCKDTYHYTKCIPVLLTLRVQAPTGVLLMAGELCYLPPAMRCKQGTYNPQGIVHNAFCVVQISIFYEKSNVSPNRGREC